MAGSGLNDIKNLTQKEKEQFWSKVILKKTGCMEWSGCRDWWGYGRIMMRSRQYRSHRLSYMMEFGAIPQGLLVRHSCDNPACVNPKHLLLGTDADNADDKARRRRGTSKLSDDDIIGIRSDDRVYRKIAEQYGVSTAIVCRIKNMKLHVYVGAN